MSSCAIQREWVVLRIVYPSLISCLPFVGSLLFTSIAENRSRRRHRRAHLGNCINTHAQYDWKAKHRDQKVKWMSGVSLPVTRPIGRALIVGSPACRPASLATLQQLGYTCAELDNPYSAMAELCRRPLVYRAMILSLASLYREELPVIAATRSRWPHLEIWLTQTDGRQAALADAMRLGADGLLAEDGMHRIALGASGEPGPAIRPRAETALSSVSPVSVPGDEGTASGAAEDAPREPESLFGEPVLTADELRALLQEQPSFPPVNDG